MKRHDKSPKHSLAERAWSKELARHAPLDKPTTIELFKARDVATDEQRAELDRLILEGNLRLVMKIARAYDRAGTRLLDLCQEGCIGAMRAIEKFDWRRDTSFPTYASWWIRQAISHCARMSGRDVRLPAHAATALKELNRSEAGDAPSSAKKSSDVVLDAVKYARREMSLSAPQGNRSGGDGKEATMYDFLVDPTPNPEEALNLVELRKAVKEGVAQLTLPELVALRMRFGLTKDS